MRLIFGENDRLAESVTARDLRAVRHKMLKERRLVRVLELDDVFRQLVNVVASDLLERRRIHQR